MASIIGQKELGKKDPDGIKKEVTDKDAEAMAEGELTHWGRVTQIRVNKKNRFTVAGSDFLMKFPFR